jgi:hypothetical protein
MKHTGIQSTSLQKYESIAWSIKYFYLNIYSTKHEKNNN